MLMLRTKKRESSEIYMFYIYVLQQKHIFITESVILQLIYSSMKGNPFEEFFPSNNGNISFLMCINIKYSVRVHAKKLECFGFLAQLFVEERCLYNNGIGTLD